MRIKAIKFLFILLAVLVCNGCTESPKITASSQEALKLYNEGVRALERFYYDEAISAFKRALQVDSNLAMASARLALTYAHTGNEAESREEIRRAMTKSTSVSKEEQLFVRLVEHALYFRNAEAAAVADSLISISPKNAEAYTLRGQFFETNKRFDSGLEMYRKAIDADSSYALAVMSLGYAYSARGDFDKAIEQMERYIRLAPDAADPRASFADILLRAGRYDEALDQYNESLKLKPDYWYAINRIGDIYTIVGRLNEADKQYNLGMTKMVMSNQVRATHLATEAVLQYYRGKYQETIRLCEQSLALDSANGKAAYVWVRALLELKRFQEAEEIIRAIREEIARRNLTESQAMLEFHILRARFFREQNMFAEATAECDSAFEYGTELNRSAVYEELAEIHFRKHDFESALDALEGAFRYNANFPDALLTLTKVYHATGDKQMTNEIGKRLLELWKSADKDFQPLLELKKLLGKAPARLSIS